MSNLVKLITESGTTEKLDKLETKISAVNPHIYWFDPDIAAYIGKAKEQETLKPCSNITIDDLENIYFKELILFGKTAGMTIIKDTKPDSYRYFYWQEQGGGIQCEKKTDTACIRDLKDQYGIHNSELQGKVELSEYFADNQRIAWTMTFVNNTNGTGDKS